jgi:hypothetical protein
VTLFLHSVMDRPQSEKRCIHSGIIVSFTAATCLWQADSPPDSAGWQPDDTGKWDALRWWNSENGGIGWTLAAFGLVQAQKPLWSLLFVQATVTTLSAAFPVFCGQLPRINGKKLRFQLLAKAVIELWGCWLCSCPPESVGLPSSRRLGVKGIQKAVAVNAGCLATSGRPMQPVITGNDNDLSRTAVFCQQLFNLGVCITPCTGKANFGPQLSSRKLAFLNTVRSLLSLTVKNDHRVLQSRFAERLHKATDQLLPSPFQLAVGHPRTD